jgi:hypothetical protein
VFSILGNGKCPKFSSRLWPYTVIRTLRRQVGFEVISEKNNEGKVPRDKDKRGLANGEVRSSAL